VCYAGKLEGGYIVVNSCLSARGKSFVGGFRGVGRFVAFSRQQVSFSHALASE